MIAVHIDQISFTYVSQPVFSGLSWDIHDDRVTALVGPNGCGKSTLMRLIAGDLSTDAGFLVRKNDLKIGYLEQHVSLSDGKTLLEEVHAANSPLAQIEDKLHTVEASLSDPEIYLDERRLQRALEQQARLLDEYTELGGPSFDGRVRSTLRDLGFSERDFSLPVAALSGGQRKLAGLACLLIQQPNLLVLDEPDTHLDLAGRAYLEKLLREFKGGVILVSHDRYLLDMVADEVVELEDGRLTLFTGNYSEYMFEKNLRLLRQQQRFQAQQKEVHRLEQSAKRLLIWGRVYDNNKFIRRGKNILNRLERMDKIERPTLERRRMGLEFSGWTGSQKVLELQNLSKSFTQPGGKPSELFSGLNLRIDRGERVGLVGPNGAGKSVLLRILLGQELPGTGEFILGPSVKWGYYAQQHETLDPNLTLFETLALQANLNEQKAMAVLNRFLFTYQQAHGRVKQLSGGERSRLQLALLMLSDANFLLLDEPTNHLDIPSAEVLEEALQDFDGTVLVISHDRYFLDQVVTRIVELDQGRISQFDGNYSDYRFYSDGF